MAAKHLVTLRQREQWGGEDYQWDRPGVNLGLPVKIPLCSSLLKSGYGKDLPLFVKLFGGIPHYSIVYFLLLHPLRALCTGLLAPDSSLRVTIVSTTQ
jgi:hypothetical protein